MTLSSVYLLGIDIGTSGCKIALFTPDGDVVYRQTSPYSTHYPQPGFVEQNPDDWWRAACANIRLMFTETRIDPKRVKGIGVDGQSWTAVPMDREGRPLRPAMIWLDRRAVAQCEELKRTIGEEAILSVSGNPLSPSYITGKLLWIKQYEPDIHARTHRIVQCNSYIVHKLTGVYSQDRSQGNGLHVYDIAKQAWDTASAERFGIDPEWLPPVYDCSEIVGEVTNAAADMTGLAAGTPVVAGGLDAACATLGAGAIELGETQEQGGQAGGMSIVVDHAVRHRELIVSCHVVKDRWIVQGGTTGGGSLNWMKREFADRGDVGFFQAADAAASRIRPGSEGLLFLPYMAGERSPIWDPEAKGVFLGLSYDKTKAHLLRAVMEGCALALHHNLRTAEASGAAIRTLHSVGGAANSRLWTQIKADVTGKPIIVPSSDTATTLGAAILAGVGTGVYRSFEEAVKRTVRVERRHEPHMDNHRIYEQAYEVYLEAYNQLKNIFPKLGW